MKVSTKILYSTPLQTLVNARLKITIEFISIKKGYPFLDSPFDYSIIILLNFN